MKYSLINGIDLEVGEMESGMSAVHFIASHDIISVISITVEGTGSKY